MVAKDLSGGDVHKAEMNLIKRSILERFPTFDPDRIYLTPEGVLEALVGDEKIKSFIEECQRLPPIQSGRGVGLLFPDSNYKPLTEATPDKALRNLYTAIKNIVGEEKINVYLLSPMLGIIPPELVSKVPNVEFSGLFFYQVKRRCLPWNPEAFRKVLDITAQNIANYLKTHANDHESWYAITRKGSIEERIFERIRAREDFGIKILYAKKPLSVSYLETRRLLKQIMEEFKGEQR